MWKTRGRTKIRSLGMADTETLEAGIERWLYQSGLSELSLAELRPDIPRWAENLRSQEVLRIPQMPSRDPRDTEVTNLLCLFVKQAKAKIERVGSEEHLLRNLTQVRPYKP